MAMVSTEAFLSKNGIRSIYSGDVMKRFKVLLRNVYFILFEIIDLRS